MFLYGKEGGICVNFPPQARLSRCSFCALVAAAVFRFRVFVLAFGAWSFARHFVYIGALT